MHPMKYISMKRGFELTTLALVSYPIAGCLVSWWHRITESASLPMQEDSVLHWRWCRLLYVYRSVGRDTTAPSRQGLSISAAHRRPQTFSHLSFSPCVPPCFVSPPSTCARTPKELLPACLGTWEVGLS